MGILATKIRRDLWRNKGRSISIIFIVALATALYGGLLLTYINAVASFDNLEEETNIQSVRFSLNEFANITNLDLDFDSIAGWDYRLATLATLRLSENAEETFVAPLYGIPGNELPKVNSFIVREGEFLENEDDLLVITQFFTANGLEIGDEIWLDTPTGKIEFNLKGSVMSPEYVYMVNPISQLPDLVGLAASWISLDKMNEILGIQGTGIANEILVRFDPDLDDDELNAEINRVKDRINRYLLDQYKDLIPDYSPKTSYTLLEDEMETIMRDGDIGVLDDFARAFGTIILLLALFIMYDNISKLIASQRNMVGTMRALGGHKGKVASHYTWLSLILGIIGVVLGVPLGYEMGNLMVEEYSHILHIPPEIIVTDFHIEPFYEALGVNFGLVLLVSILASVAAARIEPREAMASAFITQVFNKKPILERITSKIPGLRSPSITIPLRSIFRQRRKTTLTVMTYGISMVLLVASFGFMDSFYSALDHTYGDLLKYDMEAHFITPVLPSEIESVLDEISEIEKMEYFTTTATEMKQNGYNKSVLVDGLPSGVTLRGLDIIEGDDSGLVLSTLIATDFNISAGDKVQLYNKTYEVSGIAREMVAEKAFIDLEELQDVLGHEDNVTSIMVKAKNGADLKDLKNEILDSDLPIAIVMVNDEVKASFDVMIQGLMALIGVMVLIGFGTIALFSFNTIVLDVISRENEFINLRTLGGSGRKIFSVIAMQSVIVAFLGSLLAIPLSYYSSVYIMDAIVGDLMVMPVIINPESYGIGIITALLASGFGVFAAYRRIMKLNLADAMRTRVAN